LFKDEDQQTYKQIGTRTVLTHLVAGLVLTSLLVLKMQKYFILFFSTIVPCTLILSVFYYQRMHKIIALKEY